MGGNSFSRTVAIILVASLLLVLTASAISCGQKSEADGRIGVAVTILPLEDFVENVGGERVSVSVMVPPGADPHAYEPKPSQITALARARMYARVGADLEFELAWMDKLAAANREMLIVDCSRGVRLMNSLEDEAASGLRDPHIWLSPPDAETMVRNISDGLVQVDPDGKAYYEQNRDAYLQKLARLDRDIRAALSQVTNRSFMVYHPALGYFAREYNLNMLPVEREGKEPTAAGIAQLIEQARANKVKVIFVAPQRNPEPARVIAQQVGAKVISVDVLAGDYIGNMRQILSELVRAMG